MLVVVILICNHHHHHHFPKLLLGKFKAGNALVELALSSLPLASFFATFPTVTPADRLKFP